MKLANRLRRGAVFVIVLSTHIAAFSSTPLNPIDPGIRIHVASSATSGLNNGTSWSNAFIKLQDALMAAEACDTIVLASGLYLPDEGIGRTDDDRNETFNIPDSVVVLGGFPLMGGLTRDPMTNPTILSGGIGDLADSTDNSYHVIRMVDVSSATCIDGFTITLGYAYGGMDTLRNGGGIYHDARMAGDTSAPTISNCIFMRNYAETRGGAMYNGTETANAVCMPFIMNCVFTKNGCGFDGGAIFNSGLSGGICRSYIDSCTFSNNRANAAAAVHVFTATSGESSAIISNSMFSNNIAMSNGGGVHNVAFDGNIYTEVRNCQFINNVAGWSGGAIYSYAATDGFEVLPIIDSCTFMYNVAQTVDGGAIDNWAESGIVSADISNSYFKGNHADVSSGGGVMNYAAGTTSINNSQIFNCTFEANTAAYGGGINNFSYRGTLNTKIIQCLLFRDSAEYSGAIDVFADMGVSSPFMLNNTITDNYSERNAAVTIEALAGTAAPEILNCIIAGNEDTTGVAGIAAFGASATIDYSLVDTTDCAGIGGGITCGINMQFRPDARFEDPDAADFQLAAGSPAIDVGQNDSITSLGISEDLAQNVRIFNGVVDLGVFESGSMPSFCTDTIELLGISIPNGLYHAALKVIADGTVEAASLTEFKAGACIELLPGFEVVSGSMLEANIESCLAALRSVQSPKHEQMISDLTPINLSRGNGNVKSETVPKYPNR